MNLTMLIHKKPSHYTGCFLFFLMILFCSTNTFSQTDSTQKEMKFDFGITRDRDINLWPILKRTISETETDKQLLFPIYRSYQNFKFGEKRSHILPVYWTDSSKNEKNTRILSTYYPSLFHISKNYKENTNTFTLLELAPRINILEFKKSPDGLVLQNNLLFFLWYKNNQITKKSHLIVFPAYWQFSSPTKENHTLFPLYSYGNYFKRTKNYYAVTPLFWHFGSPKRRSNLLVPVWWNRTILTTTDSIKSNILFPVYYSHSDKNTDDRVVFPFIWSIASSRYKSFTLAPIFSVGHGINTNRNHLMITPLFWHFKREESTSTALFPFIWKYSWQTKFDNYQSLIVFPIYWSKQDNNSRSTVILPFIWSKTTPKYHTLSFIPLISRGHSPDNSMRHLAITPLFWHFKTLQGYSNVLLPIWWYKKSIEGDKEKVRNVILPVYWGWKNNSEQGNILFPVLWRFKNPNYQTLSLVPFYSAGKSTDGIRTYKAITPLFWQFKTAEGKGRLLFPLWWEKERTSQGIVQSTSQVFLLYWKYADLERNHLGVFPLAWRFKSKTQQSFTLFPILSSGRKANNEKRYTAITPLFWHFKNKKVTFNTFIPVWWSRNDYSSQNTKHFNLILPIYFSQTDTIKTRRVLFPVLWRFKNPYYSSFTFVPIVSIGKTPDRSVHHLALTPLFWHVKNRLGYTTTLLPVFWQSKYGEGDMRTEKTVVFPIYFYINDSKTQNRIVFPIVWSLNNNNYNSFTIAPLFSVGRNDDNTKNHYVITPLFFNIKNPNSSSKVFFPIWWNFKSTSKSGYNNSNVLFPVYWSFQNQQQSTKVIFPLIWKFQGAKSKSFTFVPIYSSGVSKSGFNHLMITPMFWKFNNSLMRQTILFPLFTSYIDNEKNSKFDILFFLFRKSKMGNSVSHSIIWPIIEHKKSDNNKYFRFAPLIWSKQSPAYSYFTIQPFYYQSKSPEHSTNRLLWELFVHRNHFGVKKANSILWKIATWDKYTNGDKEFRLLYLLFANSSVDGKVEKSLFPIYYFTKDNKGNRSLSVMLYFYNSLKRKVPNTKEFYQEERIFWLIRIRSNYRILKEKGIDVE